MPPTPLRREHASWLLLHRWCEHKPAPKVNSEMVRLELLTGRLAVRETVWSRLNGLPVGEAGLADDHDVFVALQPVQDFHPHSIVDTGRDGNAPGFAVFRDEDRLPLLTGDHGGRRNGEGVGVALQ